MYGGFGGFDGFGAMFTIVFVLIIGILIVNIVTGLSHWNKNNQSPRLSVHASVVSKRMAVSHHHHPVAGDATGAHGFHDSSTTTYFVTFQVDSGDRIEFKVDGLEYGMLVERDEGTLTFQGTRYLSFLRD